MSSFSASGYWRRSPPNPGRYLRHSNYEIRLNANDNTATIRGGATFYPGTSAPSRCVRRLVSFDEVQEGS